MAEARERREAAAHSTDGVLVLCKPPGPTSHDVVAMARRLLGQRRIGHTGTLDPAAGGVLALCVGRTTRLAEYLTAADKEYRAEIVFGVETDSLDATGAVTVTAAVPQLTETAVASACQALTGPQQQVPPAVSAVRMDGERAYKRARRGEAVSLPPRAVTIHRIDLLRLWRDAAGQWRALIDVACSKGTYIRALARDIAAQLGTVAHLGFLLRTRSGPFVLADSVTVEELREAAANGESGRLLLPPAAALPPDWPRLALDDLEAVRLRRSGSLPARLQLANGQWAAVVSRGGDLLAVARGRAGQAARAEKVFT